MRFPGLLHEMGLSGHREEALSVKLEVDTRPPRGAALESPEERALLTAETVMRLLDGRTL